MSDIESTDFFVEGNPFCYSWFMATELKEIFFFFFFFAESLTFNVAFISIHQRINGNLSFLAVVIVPEPALF